MKFWQRFPSIGIMLKLPVFHLQKCTMCLQKHTQNIRYVHFAEQSFLSWPELCTWRLFTFISIWWAVHVYKNNYNNNKICVCKLFHVHIFFTYWEVRCHRLWVALHLEQITGMPTHHTSEGTLKSSLCLLFNG